MNKISAEIIADSINLQGDRITTMLLTFPRFILSELNTHRMFSRNSASSRAIPFEKAVKMVEEDPFIPIAFQKQHKGMQGTEYFPNDGPYTGYEWLKSKWLVASYSAIKEALDLHNTGVTKQICNRLLEPFMWHKCLVTATEYSNFFNLRCPKYEIYAGPEDTEEYLCTGKSWKDFMVDKNGLAGDFNTTNIVERLKYSKSDAEIHIQALAEAMWNAMNESTPKKLNPGEWHLPFNQKLNNDLIIDYIKNNEREEINWEIETNKEYQDYLLPKYKLKIATARAARLSYMNHNGEIDYEKDIQLHDQLLASRHMSPFEHVGRAMTNEEYASFIKGKVYREMYDGDYTTIPEEVEGWCNNFKGFIQYRCLIENQ